MRAKTEAPLAEEKFTEDTLLGGRVKLRQPANGYRAAIDPVLLAAAVLVISEERVLEVGCGVGAAALCLAAREPRCRVVGIEIQPALVRLAADNLALNECSDRITIMAGDLLRPPRGLEPGFDHVMANPPFFVAADVTPSPEPGKAHANIEGDAALTDWVRFALSMVRAKGTVTFIHRADRLDQLLREFAGRAGEIVIFPFWPGRGKDAKRVIVQARKGVSTPTRLLSGLVLHEADGRYTEAADAVLRHAQPLPIGILAS
jgi:tRNA1(Val) A37 N6-methylase TrmN6